MYITYIPMLNPVIGVYVNHKDGVSVCVCGGVWVCVCIRGLHEKVRCFKKLFQHKNKLNNLLISIKRSNMTMKQSHPSIHSGVRS